MVLRHEHLFGVEAEPNRDLLDVIDGRPVDVGLTRLTQAAVSDVEPEPVEQALQRRGAAIHLRGLDDLRRKEAPREELLHDGPPSEAVSPELGRVSAGGGPSSKLPAARSTSAAGDARSTAISTAPGSPCCIGMCPTGSSTVSSTRI